MKLIGTLWLCVLLALCVGAAPRDDLAKWAPTADYFTRPFGLLSYNGMTRTGRWTLERLDKNTKHGDRSGLSFRADPDVPYEFNASASSYAGSGYDIGHLAPSADDDGDAQKATFTTANACPETPAANRGAVLNCEKFCRTQAQRLGVRYVLVYTAPAWLPGVRQTYRFDAIGASRVWVPTHVIKACGVFLTDGGVELYSWRIPNIDNLDMPLEEMRQPVDQSEGDVGLDFFKALPKEQQDRLEAGK